MDKTLNPLACDEPDCTYVARTVRKLHKHYCDRHMSGIVRPSRIAELRRIMKATNGDKINELERELAEAREACAMLTTAAAKSRATAAELLAALKRAVIALDAGDPEQEAPIAQGALAQASAAIARADKLNKGETLDQFADRIIRDDAASTGSGHAAKE